MRAARAAANAAVATFACQRAHSVCCEEPRKTRQKVFFWGSRTALPHVPSGSCRVPSEAPFFARHPKKWVEVSFGPSFGAACDESGVVVAWGLGEQPEREVRRIECTAQGKFIDVQCSEDKIYALTKDGTSWEFTNDATGSIVGREMTEIPRISGWLSSSGTVQMSVGKNHAAFLLKNGDVHMIGPNKYGECGPQNPLPIKAKSVHCGGTHTVIIDLDGVPHSFGDDSQIQLGLGDTRGLLDVDDRKAVVYSPDGSHEHTKNSKLKRSVVYKHYELHQQREPQACLPPPAGPNRDPLPIEPTLVELGDNFTVFAHRDSPDDWEGGDTHVLFCCGDNIFGQCGRNFQQHHQTWNKVRTPKYRYIDALSCGSGHCLALIKGEVWGWGRNQCGQAHPRQGSATYFSSPDVAEIQGKPVKISANFDNSCVICEEEI